MPRVVTSVTFDLKFNVLDTPPQITVIFTDQDASGRESHGKTSLVDTEASDLWTTVGGAALLDAVNAAIDVQAAAVAEPGTVAARIEAVADAERQLRTLTEATAAKQTATEALDAQIATKQARAAALDAEIAAKEAAKVEVVP